MLANFHTHTVFCDGNDTAEQIVKTAIEKGFSAIGFSGHGYTDFDLSYCMKDTEGYIAEIGRLKEKYKGKIEIYTGAEEDVFSPVERYDFDYIIGSSHYFFSGGKYYSIDDNYEGFKECLNLFENDPIKLADAYYSTFCYYILKRKPDIIGHFDLITKFEEFETSVLLSNCDYNKRAEMYIDKAADADCIFEVNTGAIYRGLRTAPYPSENLLFMLKKRNAKLIISSDSHDKTSIDFKFSEIKKYLRDIGFRELYTLSDGKFIPYAI